MRFLVIQVPKGLDRLMLSTNQSISNVNKIAASIQDIINIGSLNGTAMTIDIKEAKRHAQQVHQKLSSLDKTNTAIMKAVEAHLNSLGSTVKKAERWASAGPVMPPIYVRQAQAHFEENTLHELAPKSAVEVEEGESCTKEELDSIEDMSWWDHVKYGFSKSMDSFVEIGNSIWDGVEDRSEKAFDSFYDYGNHVTFGLFDAGVSMWDGAQMRYNEFIDDPNVFTFVNYASIGTYDMFVGTVNPDDPYSTDHWLSSAGLAGSLAGGAGLATRGAVSALKPGARNSGSVNSVKGAGKSADNRGVDDIRFSNHPHGSPYAGAKQGSQFLKDLGLPRQLRKDIMESFDVRTIRMDVASDNSYGLRFYGGPAKPNGPYLFETFGPDINRANLALPPNWNSMTGIQQWQIQPGTTILKGNAAGQKNFGFQYVGGAKQIWVPNPWENLKEIKR
ncbi:T7SS effector LXG polymorphic toxin [Bacillus sp. FSL W7-1360]